MILILFAHLTPSAFINRSNEKQSWQGIFPRLFERTSNALIYSKRHDWKRLCLLLNSIAEPGDIILFKQCDACWEFPLIFYDRDFKEKYRVERTSGKTECANWIVSTELLTTEEENCGLNQVAILNRFYVYGNTPIHLSQPIRWSRYFDH
tara:strand:- start:575 stop:1024 length:450 start_codon:yes stop_codon:yes gene_type:complete